MRARVFCLVGIALVACSQSHPTAAVSPTGHTTSSPFTRPTVAGDLPVTRVDFSCRLPVVTVNPRFSLPDLHGGFITFPAGQLAEDPNGTMPVRGYPHDDYATTVSPVLSGDGGGFYDRAAKRWVPASPAATLADGSAYADATVNSRAHIVDVAAETVLTFQLK